MIGATSENQRAVAARKSGAKKLGWRPSSPPRRANEKKLPSGFNASEPGFLSFHHEGIAPKLPSPFGHSELMNGPGLIETRSPRCQQSSRKRSRSRTPEKSTFPDVSSWKSHGTYVETRVPPARWSSSSASAQSACVFA